MQNQVVNTLIDKYRKELLSEEIEQLLNLALPSKPTQEELDEFIRTFNWQENEACNALMFSYLMKEYPEMDYSKCNINRIKALLNLFKFSNLKLISKFTKICNEFKNSNIDVMVLKGGAMKHLRPEYSRTMGDIDVLVDEKDYIKSGKIAESMGYECSWDIHSVDLHPKGSEEGIMDIHKYIYMGTGSETNLNEGLYKRATKTKIFGVDAYLPSNEDLLFISLVNLARNLTYKTSINGLYYTFFDLHYLLNSKTDFDWNIVFENAKITKTQSQLFFAIQFVNRIVPNLLPDKFPTDFISDKQIEDYSILCLYKRFFLWGMKQRSHELKFASIFSDFALFKEYLVLKPKYFILKMAIFSKNPKLANLIMNINEKCHFV